jgi:hypothetical protein
VTIDTTKRPAGPILKDATVVVMNAGFGGPGDRQGMLAISPEGCFYFEGEDSSCRTLSIDEVEMICLNFREERTTHEQGIIDIVTSIIASYKDQGRNP